MIPLHGYNTLCPAIHHLEDNECSFRFFSIMNNVLMSIYILFISVNIYFHSSCVYALKQTCWTIESLMFNILKKNKLFFSPKYQGCFSLPEERYGVPTIFTSFLTFVISFFLVTVIQVVEQQLYAVVWCECVEICRISLLTKDTKYMYIGNNPLLRENIFMLTIQFFNLYTI